MASFGWRVGFTLASSFALGAVFQALLGHQEQSAVVSGFDPFGATYPWTLGSALGVAVASLRARPALPQFFAALAGAAFATYEAHLIEPVRHLSPYSEIIAETVALIFYFAPQFFAAVSLALTEPDSLAALGIRRDAGGLGRPTPALLLWACPLALWLTGGAWLAVHRPGLSFDQPYTEGSKTCSQDRDCHMTNGFCCGECFSEIPVYRERQYECLMICPADLGQCVCHKGQCERASDVR